MTSCQPCHAGRKSKLSPGLADDMADYQATLAFTDLSVPANSQILLRPSQQLSHPTKHFDIGSAAYDTILLWVTNGAPYDVPGATPAPAPPPAAAPMNPSYLPDVKAVTMACITGDRAVPMPAALREALTASG